MIAVQKWHVPDPKMVVLAQNRTFYGRIDPSKTLALQNAWVREFNRRFKRLTRMVRQAIVDQDVFASRKEKNPLKTYAKILPGTPEWHAFDFATSQEKIDEFMRWIRTQVNDDLLQVGTMKRIGTSLNEAWTDRWVLDSYKRGILRARYEMKKAGYNVPSINETGGIEASISTPFHMDAVGILYTRVFEELKGITAAMSQQISRVLSQGMMDGDAPGLLAKKLVATIDGTGMGTLAIKDTLGRFIPARRRAELLARTETIRAHHQAMVQEYKNWRAEKVRVLAEWATAGDARVCDICSSMEGSTWTLEQIQNMIPAHPLCRCVAIPTKKEPVQTQEPVSETIPASEKKTITSMQRKLNLSDTDTKELSNLWANLSPKLDRIFEEGSPTCTVATNELGSFLESKGLNVQYVSGDFEGAGHWWNVVSVPDTQKGAGYFKRYIVDFGDNISENAIDTGHITPHFYAFEDAKSYQAEDYLSRKQFLKEMRKQGYKWGVTPQPKKIIWEDVNDGKRY